jgi:hypothetical protein
LFFLTIIKQALFVGLKEDALVIKADIKIEAGIIHDINTLKTKRIPWLEKTSFLVYLAGL